APSGSGRASQQPPSRKLGCGGSCLLEGRVSRLDEVAGPRSDGRAWLENVLEHPEIGGEALGGERAPQVTPLPIEEAQVRIGLQVLGAGRRQVVAVARGRDGRGDELRAYHLRALVVEIGLELEGGVGVHV